MLHCAKKDYLQKLSLSWSKKFRSAIKHVTKGKNSSLPTLSLNGTEAHSHSEKVEVLNEFFSQCFNYCTPPLDYSDMDQLEKVGQFPNEILCSEEEVLQRLSDLDISKADNISAHMLKATASSIAPSVTLFFNQSLKLGCFQLSGNSLM